MPKTPEELELERQLAFLKENAVEWKKVHPERWAEDVKLLEGKLSTLQPKEEIKEEIKEVVKESEVADSVVEDKPKEEVKPRGRPPKTV